MFIVLFLAIYFYGANAAPPLAVVNGIACTIAAITCLAIKNNKTKFIACLIFIIVLYYEIEWLKMCTALNAF
jgi:hypothetical protein